jgi:hypothetical protein
MGRFDLREVVLKEKPAAKQRMTKAALGHCHRRHKKPSARYKRVRHASPATCELIDLRTQDLVAGAQLSDLALKLNHPRQQLLTTQGRKVSELNHGRHDKPFV